MELKLKSHGNGQYLHKNINGEEFFNDCHIQNSVRYNTIEIEKMEGRSVVNGTVFSSGIGPIGKNLEMCVSSNCPVLKLHFSLEGGFRHVGLHQEGFSIHVPHDHCNMYYLPYFKGKDIYFDKTSKIFEVYVSQDYFNHLLCGEFKDSFTELHQAMNKNKPYALWEKSRPISLKLRAKINEIVNCPYTSQVRKCYLESKLTVLLIDFLLGKYISPTVKGDVNIPKADYQALEKVEGYIRKHLKKSLNILDLAKVAGFNATKLKRDFKKVYGITIFKYITRLRMEEAKTLIEEEAVSIANAAYEVGYANPQHFTAAFKRTMGYLPSNLKRGN